MLTALLCLPSIHSNLSILCPIQSAILHIHYDVFLINLSATCGTLTKGFLFFVTIPILDLNVLFFFSTHYYSPDTYDILKISNANSPYFMKPFFLTQTLNCLLIHFGIIPRFVNMSWINNLPFCVQRVFIFTDLLPSECVTSIVCDFVYPLF